MSMQKYAVLIGVNNYAPPFGGLEYCHNDMQKLKERLIRAGFDEENIVLMRDGTEDTTCWPSKANIENKLRLRLGLANEQDLVLVAFSGHGLHIDGASYLCPCDAEMGRPDQTMVALDTIYEQMESCRAHQRILLVDACRNEPILKGIKAPVNVRGFSSILKEPPRGIRVLSSCEAGQWSAEDQKLRHGVFMYYVLQGLDGLADQQYAGNKNGQITLNELYFFAHEKTKKHVVKCHGILQRPVLRGEFVGEYEIASVPAVGSIPSDPGDMPSGPPSQLLKQADTYFTEGEFAKAIETYTKAIRVEKDAELLRSAYRKRSTALVARGDDGDMEQALTDCLAAGQSELPLTVTADTAEVRMGDEVNAVVKKGQTVNVTRIAPFEGSVWLYVASIDGDDTTNGYILKTAVIKSRSSSEKSSITRSGNYLNEVASSSSTSTESTGGTSLSSAQTVPTQTFVPQQGWTEVGSVGGARIYRDNMTGREWTQTLGRVNSRSWGSEAQGLVSQYGFRLPSFWELQQMQSHGGDGYLNIHSGLLDYYETSDPNTLANAAGGIRTPQRRQGTGRNYVIGVR